MEPAPPAISSGDLELYRVRINGADSDAQSLQVENIESQRFTMNNIADLEARTTEDFVENYKNFDVIVGMYHDQVLAPFKALYKFNAINVTLGLKYLRASPDHGVAKNLIGKNKAHATSLIESIKFINSLS